MSAPPPVIVYLFTTFPKNTETFLQREIIAMKQHGVALELHSLWGGGGTFRGLRVARFNKWRLLTLFWLIPYEGYRRPEVLGQLLRGLFGRRAPSWMNFWENMLGAGYIDTLHAIRPDYASTHGTFTTQTPGQRVDYIFTHGFNRSRIKEAWIEYDRLAKYASDHFPVGVEITS